MKLPSERVGLSLSIYELYSFLIDLAEDQNGGFSYLHVRLASLPSICLGSGHNVVLCMFNLANVILFVREEDYTIRLRV
jgi:hypothetical protein